MSPNKTNRPQSLATRKRAAQFALIAWRQHVARCEENARTWHPSALRSAPPANPLESTRVTLAGFCAVRPAGRTLLAVAANQHRTMKGGVA